MFLLTKSVGSSPHGLGWGERWGTQNRIRNSWLLDTVPDVLQLRMYNSQKREAGGKKESPEGPDLWRISACTAAQALGELWFPLFVVSSFSSVSEQHLLLVLKWSGQSCNEAESLYYIWCKASFLKDLPTSQLVKFIMVSYARRNEIWQIKSRKADKTSIDQVMKVTCPHFW